MFDRLPTPWGLVRAGVAPDHPNIKAVTRMYEKTAAHPEFRFFGNVEIGRDITATSCATATTRSSTRSAPQTDRPLGIPGEDLPGSWAATEFVAWYNGHPDYRDLEFDLSRRARRRRRQRQRRRRRRAHARADQRGAGGHRRRRPRARGAARSVDHGDRRARPPRPRAGRVHEPRGARARRDGGRRHLRGPAGRRARPAQPGLARERRGRHDLRRERRDLHRVLAAREPEGKRKRVVLRFLASPVEILGDEQGRGRRGSAATSSRDEDGSLRARPPGESEDDPRGPRVPLRRLPRRRRCPGVPFDERARR